jgi:hypothetical protein
MDDAWWTGPLLTASASTLPRGRLLFEPYFYDVISDDAHHFGSRSYILYGLTDDVTVGLIPVFGHNHVKGSGNRFGVGVGDLTLMAQYRLTQLREGSRIPTISAVVQQSLPTGRHDRLGEHSANAIGSGAYTTTLALYSQSYFWMPNGRILRARLNVARSFSSRAKVIDASVYGTRPGFRGHARPGATFDVSGSVEYSATRNVVLAFDLVHSRGQSTRVAGFDRSGAGDPVPVAFGSGSYRGFALAPAVEYNFSPTFGVIAGARIVPASRNRTGTFTPAVAINMIL